MKKVIYVLLVVMFSSQFALAANNKTDNYSIETLPDGSYYLTIIEDVAESKESLSFGAAVMRAQKTETKSKTTYYKNSAGETIWFVRVTGTFTYGNGTSKCISSTPYASSNDAYWKVSNITGSKSGNTAIASATGKHIAQGKVLETKQKSVRLSCSPTGVFS